jgi:hypothetical protein
MKKSGSSNLRIRTVGKANWFSRMEGDYLLRKIAIRLLPYQMVLGWLISEKLLDFAAIPISVPGNFGILGGKKEKGDGSDHLPRAQMDSRRDLKATARS